MTGLSGATGAQGAVGITGMTGMTGAEVHGILNLVLDGGTSPLEIDPPATSPGASHN